MESPGTSWFFRVAERATADAIVVSAAGRVGSAAAPRLADALKSAERRTSSVILDVSDVDYISSAGIRVIEEAAGRLKIAGKALTVRGARNATRLSLDMAGVANS